MRELGITGHPIGPVVRATVGTSGVPVLQSVVANIRDEGPPGGR